MKILQIGNSLDSWGGIERYILYLSQGLLDRGHEVFCSCNPDSPLAARTVGGVLPLVSRGKFDVRAMFKQRELIRRHRFDIVHFHFSPDMYVGALAARLAGHRHIVLTRHVAEPWGPRKTKLYTQLFDRVIPVSNSVREVLVKDGVPEAKISLAKAGCFSINVSEDRNLLRQKLGFAGFTAITASRLTVEKGVSVAIEAASISRLPLHVFGEGPELPHLEKMAKDLHANVVFHGFAEDIDEVIHASDCLIVPSIWAEAFPFAVLQAMSLGRPVLASAVGGLPEMVQDGVSGSLFCKGDANELAKRLRSLAEDASGATEMGKHGKELFEANYTISDMATRIEAVYKRA